MEISERQKNILNGLIEAYIETAEPVGSKFLEEKCGFGLCPASIRIEMQKLADQGYIFQPYTSAGRIPTDKGYRFFVDELLSREETKEEIIFDLAEKADSPIKIIQLATKNLALISSDLVLGYLAPEEIFWKNGWEKIIKEPEFENKEIVESFVRLIEELEENLAGLAISSEIKVYIGRENPFSSAEEFSTIVTSCCLPKKRSGFLAILGPKRMNYDKNITSLSFLVKTLRG